MIKPIKLYLNQKLLLAKFDQKQPRTNDRTNLTPFPALSQSQAPLQPSSTKNPGAPSLHRCFSFRLGRFKSSANNFVDRINRDIGLIINFIDDIFKQRNFIFIDDKI